MIQIDGHYLDGALTDGEISTLAALCGIIHTWPGWREEYLYIYIYIYLPFILWPPMLILLGERDRHFLQTAIIFSDLHPLITAQKCSAARAADSGGNGRKNKIIILCRTCLVSEGVRMASKANAATVRRLKFYPWFWRRQIGKWFQSGNNFMSLDKAFCGSNLWPFSSQQARSFSKFAPDWGQSRGPTREPIQGSI